MPRTSYALVAALGLLLVGCASNADTGFPDKSLVPTEAPGPSCADATEEAVAYEEPIFVLDNCFVPKVATVAAGTEIGWLQEGIAPHSVTFVDADIDSHPDCNASVPGTCMADGDEFNATLTDPGEYAYYCVIHGTPAGGGMAGTIVIDT